MGFYNVNWYLFLQRWVKPLLQQPRLMKWLYSLLYPLRILHEFYVVRFRDGDYSPIHNVATSYTVGQSVRFRIAVYLCVKNAPGGAGITPDDTTYWVKMLDNFIGIRERMHYNGQVIMMEYMLNRYFGYPVNTPNPTIYITHDDTEDDGWIIGFDDDADSADIGVVESLTASTITFADVPTSGVDFMVHYPLSLNSNQVIQLQALVHKYRIAGVVPGFTRY